MMNKTEYTVPAVKSIYMECSAPLVSSLTGSYDPNQTTSEDANARGFGFDDEEDDSYYELMSGSRSADNW